MRTLAPRTKEVGIRLSVKDEDVARRALRAYGTEGQAALKRIEAAARPASVSVQALNAAVNHGKAGMSNFVGGVASGLLPIFSLYTAINKAKEGLQEFGDIADASKAAGLDSELFQGLTHQAQLAGVEFGELSGALDTFVKNSGLAAEGKGRMVTQLKALNPELLRNIQLAKTQEERIRLVADAIDKAAGADEKAAIAAAAFGEAGVRMVNVFEGGAAAIDRTMEKARELGIIVDRDLIARADELGDEFDTATKIMDLKFKQVLIDLAPLLIATAGLVGDIADALRTMKEAGLPLGDQSGAFLRDQLKVLEEIKRRAEENGGLAAMQWLRGGAKDRYEAIKAELDRRANTVDITVPYGSPGGRGGGGDLPPNDEAKKAIREAEALIKRVRSATDEYAASLADIERLKPHLTQQQVNDAMGAAVLKYAEAAKETGEIADAQMRLNQARAQGIVTEREYTDAFEKLTERRLVAQNDWLAGIELGLARIRGEADEVTTSIASAVESWADNLGEQIGAAFRTGKFEWQDLVTTILTDVAKLATQQMITRPLAGLLGSVLGGIGGGFGGGFGGGWNIPTGYVPGGFYPGFANGTPSAPGGLAWVGERGPELMHVPRGSEIIPNHRIGSTVNVSVNASYAIDGTGLSEAQLLRVLEQNNRDLAGRVSSIVKRDIGWGRFG